MTNKIDHKYTNQIICPYCGYEEHDSWEIRGDNGEHECGDCGKEFQYERIVTVIYCTKKIKTKPEPTP